LCSIILWILLPTSSSGRALSEAFSVQDGLRRSARSFTQLCARYAVSCAALRSIARSKVSGIMLHQMWVGARHAHQMQLMCNREARAGGHYVSCVLVLASAFACLAQAGGESFALTNVNSRLGDTLPASSRASDQGDQPCSRLRLRGGWTNTLKTTSDVGAPSASTLPQDGNRVGLLRTPQRIRRLNQWLRFGRSSHRARTEDVKDAQPQQSAAALNSVCQTIVVDATVEECFSSATSFEAYPAWASGIQGLVVLERGQSGIGQLVKGKW